MLRRLLKFAAVTTLAVSSYANAEWVATDWENAGDGFATLHEETGLEWLDLDFTRGISYNQVQAEISSGSLVGWRFATPDEIIELLFGDQGFVSRDRFYSGGINLPSTVVDQTRAQLFLDLFANTGSAYGMHRLSAGTSNVARLSGVRGHVTGQADKLWWNYDVTNSAATYSSSGIGHWLVSDGGVTRSSQLNPTLNINNAEAPINQVSVFTGGLALMLLGGAMSLRRRKV